MIATRSYNEGASHLSHQEKTKKSKLSPLLIYFLSVLALIIFLHGFFPLKYSSKVRERRSYVRKDYQTRYIDKLAFIVVDALRHDFVVRDDGQIYMPFTVSSILNRSACYMPIRTHSPTVTLPRLKAITSGALSTFIDVILNFMTPAFEEDNFISAAAAYGLRLVFYGDDTWIRLFPESFLRSEGTHSFYTYDYFEVDNNVTRHIDDEMKRDDWDIIILHYLGLDHIGHTEGPNSPLIRSKLLEMDNIVKKFNDYFKSLEKEKGLKTMLLLTGDHGMKDSGSHGGVTPPEITVPLVSVGNPCFVLPGWPADDMPLQIDIAPTLSTIFGVEIPVNNMGKMIPSLLHYMPLDDVLNSLEINRVELHKLTSSPKQDFEGNVIHNELKDWLLSESRDEQVVGNITRKYFNYLNNLSQDIAASNTDFKVFHLVTVVILLWIVLIFLLSQAPKHYSAPQNLVHWFFIVGTALHAVSLLSSSFIEEEHQTWYFFWATFCITATSMAFGCVKTFSRCHKVKFLVSWVVLAFMHRLLRKMNQTGDKWAFLPDIKSYLYSDDGQLLLFYLFLLGMAMVFMCGLLERTPGLHLTTYGICLLAVICYRIASSTFKWQFLSLYPESRGFPEVLVFWTSLCVFTFQTVYKQKPFYLVWLVLGSFYLRPHNVIMLPLQVLISNHLHKLFHKSEDLAWNNLAHIWLGNVFYFYQGNGNSLSNVDVAAGFVGVQSYSPTYSGLMIAAHCFNGQILSFLLSPKSEFSYALSRLLPLTVFCTGLLLQLHHLFIWSVFSPKLLFEASLTLIFLVLMAVNCLYNSLNQVS